MALPRILLYITLIFATTLFLISRDPGSTPNNNSIKYLNEPTFSFSTLKAKDIIIVKFNSDYRISLIENLDLHTTEDLSMSNECKGAINAGYFLKDYTHAGYLKVNDIEKKPLAPTDLQLTHLLDVTNPLQVLTLTESENSGNIVFQTGPLLIDNDIIQSDLITESLNGTGYYLRSAIGYTNTNELLLIISNTAMDLQTFSEEILNTESLKDSTITVINLDGGSSVSLYTENREAQYGVAKKLPFLLCIK